MARSHRLLMPAVTLLASMLGAHLPVVRADPGVSVDPALFREMRWRPIGPFRGGRTKAAAGVPGSPASSTSASCNGGVWKTTDYGRTWTPIFDDQPTGSIGAIAVAPSEPEHHLRRQRRGAAAARPLDRRRHLQVHRRAARPGRTSASATASRSRRSSSIRATRTGSSWPCSATRTARTRSAASSARPTAARRSRRSSTRTRTPAASDLAFDPSNPDIVYAVLWEARQGPWENGVLTGPGSGLFKSTDGGTTWRQLTTGLPTFAQTASAASASRSRRAIRAGCTPRSRRARSGRASIAPTTRGESWTRVNTDPRVVDARRRTSPRCKVDPKNPTSSTRPSIVTWKSTDGGKTFTAFRGAPGGDDYQRIWINPNNPTDHPARRRPGRDHHGERRRDVELAGTTSRPRSSTTSAPTTPSRTASAAGSRRAARRASRAAATTGRSRSASGTRSASRSTATSRPTRSTPTSSTAAR